MTDEPLPDAELDVMRCLWQQQSLSARAIREMLAAERPMSHSSVCTLLSRLEAKGLVTREKGPQGKAFVYRPAVPFRPTRRRLVRTLLDRVFGGRGVDLVAALFDGRPPSEAQLDELQQLLDELREKNRRRPSPRKRPEGDPAA